MFVALLLCSIWSSNATFAQFSPDNPPDPDAYYKVNVTTDPENCGWLEGGGSYLTGTTITLNTGAWGNYVFKYWTKDDVIFSDTPNCEYTVTNKNVNFVAHYEYKPSSPDDPYSRILHTLTLKSNPSGCCSFNRGSGDKYEVDTWLDMYAWPNSGYEFKGWYEDGKLISSNINFNFLMPDMNVTLTAMFVYNPQNPDDPASGGGNIDNGRLGDVNEDKLVNAMDAIELIGHYLNGTVDDLPKSIADVNKDGVINVMDAIEIINLYLNAK